MEKKAFELLKGAESSWWYRGRSAVIRRVLKKNASVYGVSLDYGAGFGALLEDLKSYGEVDALEINPQAALVCKERGYRKVFTTRAELEAQNATYTLIGAFDVIEHIEDDKEALKFFSSLLKENGYLVATLPAFSFLWSPHDVEHHHFRRYTKTEVRKLFETANFKILYISYWNVTLFLFAFIVRAILKFGGGKALRLPKFFNMFLSAVLYIESLPIPTFRYPWGTGIIVCAQKIK